MLAILCFQLICIKSNILFYADPLVQLQAPPEHNATRLSPLEKPPKHPDLLNQVATKVTDKWMNLGLQLKIEHHKLKTILRENYGDSKLCCAEMLDVWRKHGSPPYTWGTVIAALRADFVGEIRLADDLKHWVSNNYA